MDKKMSYDDIIFRIGYFRNKNNLSARETSLQLGFSDSFVNRIERKSVELKVSTLLQFMDICNITPEEFFYYKPENYEKDKELLQIIKSLSNENKDALMDIAKRLK
ncbi:MAG: helix-turn-helix transcriptional regulator [Clostridiales bacterium]|nr:helix-turn-helix transcriptional regulator [Clostridiales bacterium]